jgi:predicted Abi (CAAX) family protease
MLMINTLAQRIFLSLQTLPTAHGWANVAGITFATTAAAGFSAAVSGFIDPVQDFDPPSFSTSFWIKPACAFFVPSLVEELFWRGALLPTPTPVLLAINPLLFYQHAAVVLALHVLSHPLAGATVWPRGQEVFGDARFLFLATVVLGGATASYIVSGGSIWAAAITHGLPVALWRDFFGGEAKLLQSYSFHEKKARQANQESITRSKKD